MQRGIPDNQAVRSHLAGHLATQEFGHPSGQLARQIASDPAKRPNTNRMPLSLSLFVLSPHSRVSECRVRQEIRQTCRHRVGQEGRQANIQAHGQANSQAANPQDAVRGTPASFCPSFSLSLSPSLSISLATRQSEQAPPLPLIVFSRSLSLSLPLILSRAFGKVVKPLKNRHGHREGGGKQPSIKPGRQASTHACTQRGILDNQAVWSHLAGQPATSQVRPPLWPTCQTRRQPPNQAANYESNASLSLSLFVLLPDSHVSEGIARQGSRQARRHRLG